MTARGAEVANGAAEKACMSRRSFNRRFQQTAGERFSRWLLNQRIIVAQRYRREFRDR